MPQGGSKNTSTWSPCARYAAPLYVQQLKNKTYIKFHKFLDGSVFRLSPEKTKNQRIKNVEDRGKVGSDVYRVGPNRWARIDGAPKLTMDRCSVLKLVARHIEPATVQMSLHASSHLQSGKFLCTFCIMMHKTVLYCP